MPDPDRDTVDHHTHVIGDQVDPGYDPPSASLSAPVGDAARRREWVAALPDSGPGWDRETLAGFADWITSGTRDDAVHPKLGAQLRALLADRDGLDDVVDAYRQGYGGLRDQASTLVRERDAARAELAEVTADRERLRTVRERNHTTMTELRHRAETAEAELATAQRDAAADALEEAANDASVLLDSGARAFTARGLRTRAALVRAGTRPYPTQSERECSIPGADGDPICVRTHEQLTCDTCPSSSAPPQEPPR